MPEELIAIVSRVTRSVPGWDEALASGRAAGYRVYEAIGTGMTLETLPDEVADKESPLHALAWLALARHTARYGSTSELRAAAKEMEPHLRVLVSLGEALVEKDR